MKRARAWPGSRARTAGPSAGVSTRYVSQSTRTLPTELSLGVENLLGPDARDYPEGWTQETRVLGGIRSTW